MNGGTEMDVREKLVELIAQKVCYTWSESCDEWMPHDCGKCYANDCHISEVADHLISNGVTVQEWISVDDRLPKPFESVLVFRDGKISIDYNEGNGWFAYDFNGKRVTHWMQLPEKPKGE